MLAGFIHVRELALLESLAGQAVNYVDADPYAESVTLHIESGKLKFYAHGTYRDIKPAEYYRLTIEWVEGEITVEVKPSPIKTDFVSGFFIAAYFDQYPDAPDGWYERYTASCRKYNVRPYSKEVYT